MKKVIEEKFESLDGIIPIGDSLVPAADVELRALEEKLQVELPNDYREFLATYGASMFTEYVDFQPVQDLPHPISSTGKGHISSFYGAAVDPYQPLIKAINTFRGRMPDTMIPIGDDSGNKICLAVRGKKRGKLYYWDRSNEPPDEEEYLEDYGEPRPVDVMYQNVYQIAESFEDFVLRLEPRTD